MRTSIVTIVLAGVLCSAGTLPPRPSNGASVQVIVTAEGRHGAQTPAPQTVDFSAREREMRLPVTDVIPLQGEHAGLELYLLLDDASASSLGSQLTDLKQFIAAQPSTTSIAVGYMDNGTVVTLQKFSADHEQVSSKLRLPLSIAGASPYLSLSDLMKHWPGESDHSTRREVIVISSGIDPLGGLGAINPYLDNSIQDAQRAGIIVYTIYAPEAARFGHTYFSLFWGQSDLTRLAEETGGRSYMLGFEPAVSFTPYLNEIADHLSHQYRVTVEIRPEKKAYYRSVKFSAEGTEATLRAASRVYVK